MMLNMNVGCRIDESTNHSSPNTFQIPWESITDDKAIGHNGSRVTSAVLGPTWLSLGVGRTVNLVSQPCGVHGANEQRVELVGLQAGHRVIGHEGLVSDGPRDRIHQDLIEEDLSVGVGRPVPGQLNGVPAFPPARQVAYHVRHWWETGKTKWC